MFKTCSLQLVQGGKVHASLEFLTRFHQLPIFSPGMKRGPLLDHQAKD